MTKYQYEIHILNSMQKVFPEKESQEQWMDGEMESGKGLSALRGECISFQIAMRICGENRQAAETDEATAQNAIGRLFADCFAEAQGEVTAWTQIRRVDLAPSHFAAHAYHDEHHLKTTTGMYPDILREKQEMRVTDDMWATFWISVRVPQDAEAGEKQIQICLRERIPGAEQFVAEQGENATENIIDVITVSLNIINVLLPKQTLIHTEWFHGDCLADYYRVPVLSKEWWQIAENFVRTAAEHGMNMILTPIFTPPLDTVVGGERTTIQLVKIRKYSVAENMTLHAAMSDASGNIYEFDFTDFERWVAMCQNAGMEYFEMAHLFTQWGAEFTPKIIVSVNGKEEKLFGWHVKADSAEYREFLQAFLPALIQELHTLQIADRTIFHVSDEPDESNLESYQKSKAIIEPLLKGFPIVDALSHIDFYKRGIIEHPVPANDAIEPFLEAKVPGLWTYYCCAQWNQVSNRFFSMPGARTRILGAQLYKYSMAGFLQWGYNFYNSQFSKEHINPYEITDAGNAFPSGDPFVVYPGADGHAVASVRLMLTLEAMQDMRALQCLEGLIGREKAEEILMEGTEKLSFSKYPRDSRWICEMRERVNRAISEQMQKCIGEA